MAPAASRNASRNVPGYGDGAEPCNVLVSNAERARTQGYHSVQPMALKGRSRPGPWSRTGAYPKSPLQGSVRVSNSPSAFASCRLASRVARASPHSGPTIPGERSNALKTLTGETRELDTKETSSGESAVAISSEIARTHP